MTLNDEQLFDRFRRGGDAAALGDLFDRVAPTLLRAALHLARDPAEAEDLLQSTFLRAIEVRDVWDASRPLLPWLFGILQNRARHERWQRERAPDPTRLTTSPPHDPVRAAERAEFDAAVDAAIAGLPELYRPVLRLHLAYDHQPAEIAHVLDRPPGTVRSQLARGLELLRKLLPAGFVGGAAITLTAGHGLAAVKQVVMGHAMVATPTHVAAAALGGSLTMKKLMTVTALTIVTFSAWWAWPRSDPASSQHDVAGSPERQARLAIPELEKVNSPVSAPLSDRVAAAIVIPKTTGSLRLTCRWGEDGSPAFGVQVNVTPSGVRDGALLQRTVQAGDDGAVLVLDLPAGDTLLEADRGGTSRVEVVAGETSSAELVIPPGIHVRGRVVDASGAAVPAARVWLSEAAHDYCEGGFVTTADQAGQFSLRCVEPERFLSASAAGLRSAVVVPVRGDAGATLDVELVLRDVGVSLIGRVIEESGRPVAGALVLIGWRGPGLRWLQSVFNAHRPPIELSTDVDGTFTAHGLEPGTRQAVWVRAVGTCLWHQIVELNADRDTVIAVQLETGATLTGCATDGAGRPVPRAYVDYRSTAWFSMRGDFHDFRGPSWSHSGASTDADGRFRIECITPGTLRLIARTDDMEVRGELPIVDGESATWDPVLVEIAIRGRVVDERGAPLEGVDVTALAPRGKGNMASAKTDIEGQFVCRTLAMVPYVMTFHVAKDRVRARPAATLFGVQPCGEPLLVRVPDAAIPRSTLVGRLLDTDGRPAEKASVSCSAAGLHAKPSAEVNAATGEFRIGPVPAGTYRVQGSIGDHPSRRSAWSEPMVVQGGEVRDVGVVQMPESGSIALTATGPDGLPLDAHGVALEDSTGWSENPWLVGKLDHGELRIERVAPGAYRVRVGGEKNLPTIYEPVTVTAGQETRVELHVPNGVAVELVLSPVTEPVPIHETFEWTRDGVLFERYDNWLEGHGEFAWPRHLLPGIYEVTVTSETGKREWSSFTVTADDPPGRRIAIKLP